MTMSDTTAFLAGCAISGVAAVFLLRGGFAIEQPRVSQPLPQPNLPSLNVLPSSAPAPAPSVDPLEAQRTWSMTRDLEQQQQLTTSLKDQLERQQDETETLKRETELLKLQLEQQKENSDKLIMQLQDQQRVIEAIKDDRPIPVTPPMPSDTNRSDSSPRLQLMVLLGLGVGALVILFGGGALLLVMLLFFLQSQRRPNRTVNVIQPMPQPYPLPMQPLLPPSPRTRRAKQIDYEYFED